MKKLLLLIVCLAACVAAYAQDIIVLADGSAIQAKVEKITPTEIEYKKAANPTGPTYTVNIKDVMTITYENGTCDTFNDPAATVAPEKGPANVIIEDSAPRVNAYSDYRTQETASGFSSDNDLKALYYVGNADQIRKEAKRLKLVGWTVGISAFVVGGVLLGLGVSWDQLGVYNPSDCRYDKILTVAGPIVAGAGICTTAVCLYKSHRLNQRVNSFACVEPVWNHEFLMDNGNTLSLGVDAMRIGFDRMDLGLGLGIRYNF